ncbi:MAG: ferrous iron transport protein B [Bacteroidota bacterium]
MDSTTTVSIQQTKLALVGNPNCGKTSIFNALSGLNQHVGNFAGVTVERKSAVLTLKKGHTIRLTDLPGTQSLYASAEDERISCQILQDVEHEDHPDGVIVVADATQLKRGLILCSQVLDLGFPAVLVINMMDLLEKEMIQLDLDRLSQWLGIAVVGISALTGAGLSRLKKVLQKDLRNSGKTFLRIPPSFDSAIEKIQAVLNTSNAYLAYQALISPADYFPLSSPQIEASKQALNISEDKASQLMSNELLVRKDLIDGALSEVMQQSGTQELSLTEKLDRIFTHKILGYGLFIGLMLLIFQAIFAWATYPMDWIDAGIEGIKTLLSTLLPAHWLRDLLTEGIITGFGGIVIFIPQIAFLFFFIAVMEESGYMARVVYLMDRIMRPFGFSGKSVIPLMGGMACAIPSIMMSRNIPNRRERLITILVTPLMSCSARIPVYTLLIAMFVPAGTWLGFDQRGLIMTALYFLGFVAALLMAFMFKLILKTESRGMFVLEMPSYRMPRWRNVGLTVWQKSRAFVLEAGKIILAISIILWFLVAFGPGDQMQQIDQQYDTQLQNESLADTERASLEVEKSSAMLEASYAAILGKTIEPVIRPLGYDWKIGIALITSFAAREVFVGTMSIIYQQEDPESLEGDDAQSAGRLSLIQRLQAEVNPRTGQPQYTLATVWSLLIFYAFAMQCMSTLAVTRKEAGWGWTGVMLGYLTILAYVSALVTYLVMS